MRILFVSIILFVLPHALPAQVEAVSTGETKDPGFLLTTLSYTSNNNSSRLANAIRMPALMANMGYYSNIGLYATGDFFKYLAPTTNTYEFELQIGYEKTFQDKFGIDFSYTNRHFRGDLAYEGISYNHDLQLAGSYELRDFTATVDNSFMIGQTDNYFLDLSLSYDFTFDRFLLKSGYLAFSPAFTGSFGTTFWLPGTINNTWGHHHMGWNHMGNYVPKKNFDYQNISLILPVQYTVGSFTLSGGWFYAIPSKTLKEQSWTNQSGFLVSLSYAVIF
jgi:hypothetical protein